MRNEKIIATCGCVCELSASYNWADEHIEDVEINILTPCDFHAPTKSAVDVNKRCTKCHAIIECQSVYCDTCGSDVAKSL